MADLTEREFRDVMGRFATGVSVMATVTDGIRHGMTASAVASLSLQPLLVLVCVERVAVMHDVVLRSGHFALSWLREDQEHLSRHFAASTDAADAHQFGGIGTSARVTGAPIIDGALGYVDCRVWADYDGGDHTIVCGEVVAVGLGDPGEPLLYYASAYRTTRPAS